MPADASDEQVGALQREIDRLQAELVRCSESTRAAEEAAGALRAELIETYRALDRAVAVEAALRARYDRWYWRAARRGRRAVRRLRTVTRRARAGR